MKIDPDEPNITQVLFWIEWKDTKDNDILITTFEGRPSNETLKEEARIWVESLPKYKQKHTDNTSSWREYGYDIIKKPPEKEEK